ncbi:MAG: LemA family protein [Neisseriaceae bacterium]|nr:LemA family protein [Neisseriaceae bacterium]
MVFSLLLFMSLVLLVLYVIGVYNGLVTRKNHFKNSYSQIDVQLKRRYDLIPNLVALVKQYMTHEKETLEAVIAARNQATKAESHLAANLGDKGAMQSLMAAESVLNGHLGKLLAVLESYPELKANENMAQLQEELTSTENKVGFARQAFNDDVMDYNIFCEKFPNNVIAIQMGFKAAEPFVLTDAIERAAPKIQF